MTKDEARYLIGIFGMLFAHAKRSEFLGGLSETQVVASEEALEWLKRSFDGCNVDGDRSHVEAASVTICHSGPVAQSVRADDS